jgi:hypothetical protein
MTAVTDRTYLDVGAVRIQTYLGRSRHLWGRRGASAVLSARARTGTNPDLLAAAGADGVIEPNTEAPEVDGVVSVVVCSSDPAVVESAARGIAQVLTRDLPGLQLTARCAVAPTYIEAYDVMAQTAPLLQWLPAQFEYPPSLRCEECGQGEAVEELRIVNETLRGCDDCAGRRRGPSRHPALLPEPGIEVGTFTIEATLLKQTGGKATCDFAHLATLGDDARGNHLATIAADGNSLGQLFVAARERLVAERREGRAGDADLQRISRLSTLVTATTQRALLTATRTIFDAGRDDHLPVVPHILGGDDVLVSVPAASAWPFVQALLTAFAGNSDEARELAAAAKQLGVPTPTLSAGVVISHASLPFGQQVTLSERLLKQAKQHVAGADFSMAWLDTTWDGTRLVPGRRPMTLTDLSTAKPGLDALRTIPKSARQVLAREIDTADDGLAQQRVRSRLVRQDDDVANAVRSYLDSRGKNLLTAQWRAPEMVRKLTDGLSLSRWWR